MGKTFVGVDKMLLRENSQCPIKKGVFCFVVMVLLCNIIEKSESYQDFHNLLNGEESKSLLVDHWIKNRICSVLLMMMMMMFVQAEQEEKFSLHYELCNMVLPDFIASHWNYALDKTVYLRSLEKLPDTLSTPFLKEENGIRLQDSLPNGIWNDMGIE